VLGDDAPVVHAIELVAAENEEVIEIVVEEVNEIFANRVRRALIPGGVGESLFSREDFDKAAGELIELIRLRNVPVQRRGIELGQEINALETGVDAIGNRDVDKAIFAAERDGGFTAVAREWKESRALSAAHNDGEDVARIDRHACLLRHSLELVYCSSNLN